MACSRSKDLILKKLQNKEEILQTVKGGVELTRYFSSNSGYYLSSELGMIRNCACL